MGLLDKLWDDTVAGPCPDTGLGKLRKIAISDSSMATPLIPVTRLALGRLMQRRASAKIQGSNVEAIQVTQSITIIKPPPYLPSLSMDSSPSSADSSPPISPSSLTARERENPWRSNKQYKKGSEKSLRAEPRSPKVYD